MNSNSLFLILAVSTAGAQTRTSASYNQGAETVDGGGGRSASASYTNDGSSGGTGGVSTFAAPVETVRHGYAGQLYEITALQLAATPATVNETATRQLSAVQLLDDSTTFPVTASAVAWSVQSGPLTSVSTSGIVTASTVFQDTTASVQGLFAGLSGTLNLTVVNSNPDNYGLFAGDGLPDDWQNQYFAASPANAAPAKDPDGDDQNNLFEFIAGLIPTSAVSRFQLDIQPVPRRLVFSPRLTDRTYTVQWTLNPATGPWATLTGATTSDTGSVRTVTDPGATSPRKYYRVQIQKP